MFFFCVKVFILLSVSVTVLALPEPYALFPLFYPQHPTSYFFFRINCVPLVCFIYLVGKNKDKGITPTFSITN